MSSRILTELLSPVRLYVMLITQQPATTATETEKDLTSLCAYFKQQYLRIGFMIYKK